MAVELCESSWRTPRQRSDRFLLAYAPNSASSVTETCRAISAGDVDGRTLISVGRGQGAGNKAEALERIRNGGWP